MYDWHRKVNFSCVFDLPPCHTLCFRCMYGWFLRCTVFASAEVVLLGDKRNGPPVCPLLQFLYEFNGIV